MRPRKERNVGLRSGEVWDRAGARHAAAQGRSKEPCWGVAWGCAGRTWGSARDAVWCHEGARHGAALGAA